MVGMPLWTRIYLQLPDSFFAYFLAVEGFTESLRRELSLEWSLREQSSYYNRAWRLQRNTEQYDYAFGALFFCLDIDFIWVQELAIPIRFLEELPLSPNRSDVYFTLGSLHSILNVPDPRRSSIITNSKPPDAGIWILDTSEKKSDTYIPVK